MIKNIIFDVGDVLLEYRWKDMLTDYGMTSEEALRIGQEMFRDDLWSELDLANFTEAEIIEKYQEKYPEDKEVIAWFITHGEYMHVTRPKVWAYIPKLKEKGYRLYILSNYSENLFKKHTAEADFLREMDGIVVSYMIHRTKPSLEIYRYLLDTYALKAEECIFFDDRAENTKAAEALGIRAVTITSQEKIIEELEKLCGK